MAGQEVLISVVIPVKNGDAWLDECITAIMKQTLFSQTEIVVVDSGSTDDSIEILRKYPVRLFSIPAQQFNHGLTRNFAASQCAGQYVVMTVQDAVAADDRWLEALIQEFNDEKVAAVCGQQIVPHHPDKNPLEWYRPASRPVVKRYHFPNPAEFEQLTPAEKKAVTSWDNVNAMYRRTALLELPFTDTVFGEDMIWAKQALISGRTIVYNPLAKVHHYHHENQEYVFKRTLTTYYFRYKHFGLVPAPAATTIRKNLSIIKTVLKAEGLSPGARFSWWRYNIKRRSAINKAYKIFTEALANGENALDMAHEKYCSKPPVPVKKNSKNGATAG